MASGPLDACVVDGLVDKALQRLLDNPQATDFFVELSRLREENEKLKASIQVDDQELSRLWATIGKLSRPGYCDLCYTCSSSQQPYRVGQGMQTWLSSRVSW